MQQSSVAGGGLVVPSGRVIYDGKRMRKAITRRTVDYSSGILQLLIDRTEGDQKKRLYASLQPTPSHIINLLPPLAYPGNPINAVTTKFIHLSLNKQRCPINAVRWTPDGRRLLTGTSTGEFTLWNGTTFNFETILQAHESAIRAMCWSHGGNFLVTGDHGGFIKVWQPSMNNLKVLAGHQEPVRQVTFSPNDAKFASCSDDGTVKIWDFEEMHEERCLTGHGWDVKTIHWHPYKALLASGSKDNLIKLWDPRSGSNVATIHGHKNNILDVKWNRNGNWLLTASKDQIVKLFDIRTMREVQTYRSHKKEVNTCCWHPFHEQLFATGGAEGAIYFHLDSQEEPVGVLEGAHDGIVWSLDWHPLGHLLTSGSADCSARFWIRHRPGDTIQDKFILGKQAAEALGIVDTSMQNQQMNEAEEDDILPGLGSDRRPPPGPGFSQRSAQKNQRGGSDHRDSRTDFRNDKMGNYQRSDYQNRDQRGDYADQSRMMQPPPPPPPQSSPYGYGQRPMVPPQMHNRHYMAPGMPFPPPGMPPLPPGMRYPPPPPGQGGYPPPPPPMQPHQRDPRQYDDRDPRRRDHQQNYWDGRDPRDPRNNRQR